ncbi:hypothetical protein RJT34_29528 [Clitoria ternatea]|uniref:F-box domain-containing protein n=1 Tax=Clitoria ternatea TaxID=43366 RepID=A0AAN9FFE3_CLITE
METCKQHCVEEQLPEEIIRQILSRVDVKSLIQFKCVSRSWKDLISEPSFTELHLHNIANDDDLVLDRLQIMPKLYSGTLHNLFKVPFFLRSLINNPSSPRVASLFTQQREQFNIVAGSCNGLLCVVHRTPEKVFRASFWNLATRSKSQNCLVLSIGLKGHFCSYSFGFGYNPISNTYKIVTIVVAYEIGKTKAKVCNMDDNCWRNIQNFPDSTCVLSDGQYLCGTLNWMVHVKDVGNKIVSLNLRKETCTELSFPKIEHGFTPNLGGLGDSLCVWNGFHFCGGEFVIWKMKDFGDDKSWIAYVNIKYENLPTGSIGLVPLLFPLWMFKNGDVLLLASVTTNATIHAFLYNQRDHKLQHFPISTSTTIDSIYHRPIIFCESLVMPI